MRWLTIFYDFRLKWTATAAIRIHPIKAWLSQLVNFKNAIWMWGHFRRTICNKIVFKLGKMYGMLQTAFRPSCMNRASVLSGIRDSRKAGSLWGMLRGVGGVMKSIHHNWLAKGLGLLCWGFKGVQEEILSEEASTLQIGSVAFLPGQCTSPQLHPCHRLFDSDGHQDQALLPVTFAYALSSEAVVMRQLRRWKRLWWKSLTHSHKRTSMGPSRRCWNGNTAAGEDYFEED